jgi:hypothetical protein
MIENYSTSQSAHGTGIALATHGSTAQVTINGLNGEEIHKLIEANSIKKDQEWEAKVALIQLQYKVTREAVIGFLQIVGKKEVPLEKLQTTLNEVAIRYKDLLNRVEGFTSIDTNIQALLDTARQILLNADSESAYDSADQILKKVEDHLLEADEAASSQIEAIQEQRQIGRLKLGEARAARGELWLIQFKYKEAANFFKEAADVVKGFGKESLYVDYLNQFAHALQLEGTENGNSTALEEAKTVYEQLLNFFKHTFDITDLVDLHWRLGSTLGIMGERSTQPYYLERARDVFKAAIDILNREKHPKDWAMTQLNLGNVLKELAKRQSQSDAANTDKEALTAFTNALDACDKERFPFEWANVQYSMGGALLNNGEELKSSIILMQAMKHYENALSVYTRDSFPLEWAATQNGIGYVLNVIGLIERMESDSQSLTHFKNALSYFQGALYEYKEDRFPLDWAMTQMNIGNVHSVIANLTNDQQEFNRSLEALNSALSVYSEKKMLVQWAMVQHNLGINLSHWGYIQDDKLYLKAAINALTKALEVRTLKDLPNEYHATRSILTITEQILSSL